jgi:hypothetical protein
VKNPDLCSACFWRSPALLLLQHPAKFLATAGLTTTA